MTRWQLPRKIEWKIIMQVEYSFRFTLIACAQNESHCFDSRAIDIRLKDTQELAPRKKTSRFFDTRPQLTPSKNTPAKMIPKLFD